ncbi:MAG: hypothetical protein ABEK50_16940, partial [bacterium]
KRTKRFLPGASITATIHRPGSSDQEPLNLLETWGPYHFYGKNIEVPASASAISLQILPPRVGRHADMKEQYIDPASARFSLKTSGDNFLVQGPAPEPTPEDVTLGADVSMALEEALSTTIKSPYRIGFIAEHSEPFWIFDTYRTDDINTDYNIRLARIPQSANRHLEIVLLDAKSNRLIPHADVSLDLKTTDSKAVAQTRLPFLMSAFYHYGNTLYIPSGEYSVDVTIGPPSLHTLEKNQFSDTRTATFNWSAKQEEKSKQAEHDH